MQCFYIFYILGRHQKLRKSFKNSTIFATLMLLGGGLDRFAKWAKWYAFPIKYLIPTVKCTLCVFVQCKLHTTLGLKLETNWFFTFKNLHVFFFIKKGRGVWKHKKLTVSSLKPKVFGWIGQSFRRSFSLLILLNFIKIKCEKMSFNSRRNLLSSAVREDLVVEPLMPGYPFP